MTIVRTGKDVKEAVTNVRKNTKRITRTTMAENAKVVMQENPSKRQKQRGHKMSARHLNECSHSDGSGREVWYIEKDGHKICTEKVCSVSSANCSFKKKKDKK